MDNMGSSQASLSRRSFIGGGAALGILPLLPKHTNNECIQYQYRPLTKQELKQKYVDIKNIKFKCPIYQANNITNINDFRNFIDKEINQCLNCTMEDCPNKKKYCVFAGYDIKSKKIAICSFLED